MRIALLCFPEHTIYFVDIVPVASGTRSNPPSYHQLIRLISPRSARGGRMMGEP